MIRQSFIFLDKVGRKKEENLWKEGVLDWNAFLRKDKVKGIAHKDYFDRKILEARKALLEDDSSYFIGKLPRMEMWRLYEHFKEECCFLDIEADGDGKITIVGISNYYDSNFFVLGNNLTKDAIEKELSKYKIIVSFNGSSYDLPKLKKLGIRIGIPHIDLKPICINLGLKGGLKEIELQGRPDHLRGSPVSLWKSFHASGDREYLELLIEYNREDVENLKHLMDRCYSELSKLFKRRQQSLKP